MMDVMRDRPMGCCCSQAEVTDGQQRRSITKGTAARGHEAAVPVFGLLAEPAASCQGCGTAWKIYQLQLILQQ